jgi:hypothetical protein
MAADDDDDDEGLAQPVNYPQIIFHDHKKTVELVLVDDQLVPAVYAALREELGRQHPYALQASLGGSQVFSSTMFALINLFKEAKAKVKVVAPISGASVFLALAAAELTLSPGVYFEFTTAAVEPSLKAWLVEYLKELMTPFITEKELKELLKPKKSLLLCDSADLAMRATRHWPAKPKVVPLTTRGI